MAVVWGDDVSRKSIIISHRPDTHPLNGFTDAELERDANAWAIDHGLIDFTVAICLELPVSA